MYRPLAYAIDDLDMLHAAIRERVFATVATVTAETIRFAYAPVVLDPESGTLGGVRFHLAVANPLAQLDGFRLRFSFLGPDAYISPDWYETRALVPTWNYIAVEGEGRAQPLGEDALRQLLIDLSKVAEEPLRPKPPWTIDKVPAERMALLLKGIRGFAVPFDKLEGKFKLSQDKNAADLAGAISGLEARGDHASVAVANAMRKAAGTTEP